MSRRWPSADPDVVLARVLLRPFAATDPSSIPRNLLRVPRSIHVVSLCRAIKDPPGFREN